MRSILQKTPLKTGNLIAYGFLAFLGGFAAGWISSYPALAKYLCFPLI